MAIGSSGYLFTIYLYISLANQSQHSRMLYWQVNIYGVWINRSANAQREVHGVVQVFLAVVGCHILIIIKLLISISWYVVHYSIYDNKHLCISKLIRHRHTVYPSKCPQNSIEAVAHGCVLSTKFCHNMASISSVRQTEQLLADIHTVIVIDVFVDL